MTSSAWQKVRIELGRQPIIDGRIGTQTPLHVERYLYQAIECAVSGVACTTLITQFGGGQVREGELGHWRSLNLPSQSILVPAGMATHWHYSGTVDFAIFYLLNEHSGICESLRLLAQSRDAPMAFSDPLVGAASQQMVNELSRRRQSDDAFLERLAGVMLEQSFRVLTTPAARGINPRHIHFARLQAVLNHINEHLGGELSVETLAAVAEVSTAHFRRLFQLAMGMPPHRYIMSTRLEQGRKWLSMSSMPIAQIAQECGFSSQSHFTACFRAAHAVTPAAFRARLR